MMSRLRRLVPYALVATLGAGALAGALLGNAATPTGPQFSLQPANPQAVQALRGVVEATLRERSFVIRDGTQTTTFYDAPDRTRMQFRGGTETIAIGRRLYTEFSNSGSQTSNWVEQVLPPQAHVTTEAEYIHSSLESLLGYPSIERRGASFILQRVVPASEIRPGSVGQARYSEIVLVRAGRVQRVTENIEGTFRPVARPTCRHCVTIEFKFPSTTTYSAFGRRAVIVAPPEKDVTKTICRRTRHRGGYECH